MVCWLLLTLAVVGFELIWVLCKLLYCRIFFYIVFLLKIGSSWFMDRLIFKFNSQPIDPYILFAFWNEVLFSFKNISLPNYLLCYILSSPCLGWWRRNDYWNICKSYFRFYELTSWLAYFDSQSKGFLLLSLITEIGSLLIGFIIYY